LDVHLFLSTFGLIFLAELPDKTALATLVLASRHRAWPVFVGAACALAIQSLIAIVLGAALSRLPSLWVHYAAAALFVAFGVILWFKREEDPKPVVEPYEDRRAQRFSKVAGAAFVVNFIAEWGDITQLATATLVAKYAAPWTVFSAATLALWSVAGLAAALGHHAKRLIHPRPLQKAAACIFTFAGILLLIRG